MIKRLLRSVFPPPRRSLGWRDVLAPGIFLIAFGVACVCLEWLDVLVFTAPGAFILTAALPWLWWTHNAGYSGLRGGRSVVALMVRLCVAGALIVLMAEPRAVRKSTVLSVAYVLDVSDSIGEKSLDDALSYVAQTVTEKPYTDEAGLVVFGRDMAVELPPRTTFPFEPFEAINSRIAADGTDLGKALLLAAAVLPESNSGRIVLISDGVETQGNLSEALDELKSRQIPVDVVPVGYSYEHEVWVEKLELPRLVKARETYEAAVVLSSLQAGFGRLVLRENGEVIHEEEHVEYGAGKTRYALSLYMRGPGYFEYEATIEPPAGMDGWRENNKAVGHLYLQGEGKVLLVRDRDGDERDWVVLEEALVGAKFLVEERWSYEFPRDPLSLLPYDCVIFVNVAADAFDVVQMQALHDAVFNQGLGFLMVGGANSFGPGGYHRTAVEKALPVKMDISQKKVLPKGALAIVLHTCEFAEGNTWGKRITKEAVRVLSAKDEVGVLVDDFSGGEKWLFGLTPAAEYERLFALINQAQIGDMPDFGTTMRMGLNALSASDAAIRHMIIISDGDPSPPTDALLDQFVDAQISVSTVCINPHGPQDVGQMRRIAAWTKGRFYYPKDPALLPAIFIKEATTLTQSMIQTEDFTPQVQAPSPVLKGITALPKLHGYVLTTPKSRALTVLKGPEEEQVDPVLAIWQYGLGKTAAFTSDLSPNWAEAWTRWDRYLPFVKQLVTDISKADRPTHLQVRSFASGSSGVVVVEDYHPEGAFLDVEVTVTGPQGRSENVPLQQVGPRRYEGRFPLRGEGRYQVVGASVGGGRNERIMGGFVVPYSPEYLRFRADPVVLRDIAQQTGGRVLSGAPTDAVFVEEREPRFTSRPVADLFLVLLACLIPVDVGVRRIQLDWALIRGWLGFGKKVPSGETLAALLQRKRSIEFLAAPETGRRRTEAEPARARRLREEKRPSAPAPEAKEARGKEPAPEPVSTTQRLLARKKKWKGEQ